MDVLAPHRASRRVAAAALCIFRAFAQRSLSDTPYVIRLAESPNLTPPERYGLDLLLDLSRLARVDDAAAPCVEVRIVDRTVADPATASEGGVHVADGVVEVPRALLRWATDIGGAATEQRSTARDRYDRVPAEANPLVQAGLERQPVVSRRASALRDAARHAAGSRPFRLLQPWPDGRRWAVGFSHDLDAVVAWPAFTALRLAELARKRELRRAARTAGAALRSIGRDPLQRGALDLVAMERELGVRSTWFVLSGTPTLATMRAGDLTYSIEARPARVIVAAVRAASNEIGLHGSFATMKEGERFAEQRARLERVAGVPVSGVRQHYLRMRPGETQRSMVRAGFLYDSTFGFADRNGFRLGIADVAPAWDERAQEELPLPEVPFMWMDRALSKYRGVERPDAWVDDALALADASREAEGLWTGIWHPNLTTALGFPDAPAAYARLLDRLIAASPWIAPLGEIVGWRSRRRRTRVRAIRADGSVDAVAPAGDASSPVPRLETFDGRAAEWARSLA